MPDAVFASEKHPQEKSKPRAILKLIVATNISNKLIWMIVLALTKIPAIMKIPTQNSSHGSIIAVILIIQ